MKNPEKIIKCVVWDLDNTLWDGILLENNEVTLRQEIPQIIKILDERGILQSISSKNEKDIAAEKLKELGLLDYFLYPQINWDSKANAIRTIARNLNIGLNSIAFVDDQQFELDEVAFSLPGVTCIHASKIPEITGMKIMNPLFVTEDSAKRRKMYVNDIKRHRAEESFTGSKNDFLKSLDVEVTVFPAGRNDLMRAEELTVRTNQLNATGYTYSYSELDAFRNSDAYKLLMVGLKDRYGDHGHVGLTLLECEKGKWTIKLLIVSCRVMSYGIGSILLTYLMYEAKDAGVELYAEYIENTRNRMMNVTYRLAGFEEKEHHDRFYLLQHPLTGIPGYPDYAHLKIEKYA